MIKKFKSLQLLVSFCLVGCAPDWSPSPRFDNNFFLLSEKLETVRVQKGESVYVISKRYRVSMRGIINFNNLKPPYTLQPGQVLRLPDTQMHLVKQGESLYAIARSYKIGINALARKNNITKPYIIFPGQTLALPYSGVMQKEPQRRLKRTAEKVSKRGKNRIKSSQLDRKMPTSKVESVPRIKGFVWPVRGSVLSKFGPGGKGMHNDGINIAINKGSEVRAARYGTVVYSGNEVQGFGKLLLIKHSDGWMTAYAHNEELLVVRGEEVQQGQIISKSGNSGNVRMPQLHFELRQGTKAVDPLKYLGS